jgi:nicotinate phosphoribosyltransferase
MSSVDFVGEYPLLVGDTADVSAHRDKIVLRNEGLNPIVTMEFSPIKSGIFCGISEVKALLSKVLPETNHQVWALEEGNFVAAGELALSITAPYASFGLYETSICGILSHSTGWATASKECVSAAGIIPVISVGARHVHPSVAGVMDYAAVIGGCLSCSTTLGAKLSGINPTGTISSNVALIMGDTVSAMQAFDKHIPPEISRVAPVNVIKDETEESISLVRIFGQRLRGVILDDSLVEKNISPNMVKELRVRLDITGYSQVDILVRGNLDACRISEFVDACAPVNAFEVGRCISACPPHEFSSDIHVIDGIPIARRGRIPGSTLNPRLVEVM